MNHTVCPSTRPSVQPITIFHLVSNQPICPPVYPSIQLLVCQFVQPIKISVHLSSNKSSYSTCSSIHVSNLSNLSTYLSIYWQSVNSSVHLSIHPTKYLSIYPSVKPTELFVHLFVQPINPFICSTTILSGFFLCWYNQPSIHAKYQPDRPYFHPTVSLVRPSFCQTNPSVLQPLICLISFFFFKFQQSFSEHWI